MVIAKLRSFDSYNNDYAIQWLGVGLDETLDIAENIRRSDLYSIDRYLLNKGIDDTNRYSVVKAAIAYVLLEQEANNPNNSRNPSQPLKRTGRVVR